MIVSLPDSFHFDWLHFAEVEAIIFEQLARADSNVGCLSPRREWDRALKPTTPLPEGKEPESAAHRTGATSRPRRTKRPLSHAFSRPWQWPRAQGMRGCGGRSWAGDEERQGRLFS